MTHLRRLAREIAATALVCAVDIACHHAHQHRRRTRGHR